MHNLWLCNFRYRVNLLLIARVGVASKRRKMIGLREILLLDYLHNLTLANWLDTQLFRPRFIHSVQLIMPNYH